MKAVQILACILWVLLLLFSCAGMPPQPQKELEFFSLLANVPLEISPDKVLYQAESHILIAFSAKNQEIYFFKDGLRQNVLGGLGASFMYLSDIALAQDGTLLTLDSAARKVTKFSLDGQVLGSLELKGSVQPVLIAVQSDQSLFVYDSATAEIIAFAAIDGAEQYRFGRFQLSQISALSCNRDFLVAYSKASASSQIFSVLGQAIKTEAGMVVYDNYNNAICHAAKTLKSLEGNAILPVPDAIISLSLDRDILVLVKGNIAGLYQLNYLQDR